MDILPVAERTLLGEIYNGFGDWNNLSPYNYDVVSQLRKLGLIGFMENKNTFVVSPLGAYWHCKLNKEEELKEEMDYKEVIINVINISEIFADVCDGAGYLLMDILKHHEHMGKPLSIEETLETWDKVFDMVWKKRIGVGKGN